MHFHRFSKCIKILRFLTFFNNIMIFQDFWYFQNCVSSSTLTHFQKYEYAWLYTKSRASFTKDLTFKHHWLIFSIFWKHLRISDIFRDLPIFHNIIDIYMTTRSVTKYSFIREETTRSILYLQTIAQLSFYKYYVFESYQKHYIKTKLWYSMMCYI